MTQANRTLVTLLAVTAAGLGLGLYAYFGVFVHDRKEGEQKDATDRLFLPSKVDEKKADGGAIDAEFVKLTVTARGETTVLEREPGKDWRLTSPVQGAADRLAVDSMVTQLQQSKFKRVIEETPDPAAVTKYGLDKPDFILEAVAEVGPGKEKRAVKLEGGIENTYDGSIYMRRNGEPKVYAAEGGVKWSVAKNTFELRDKEVVGIDETKVKSLEVKGRNNAYTLTADSKKGWKVSAQQWAGMKVGAQGLAFDGDPTTINGALQALKQERATAFPKDTPEARAAFEHPTLDATVVLEGDLKVRLRLIQPAGDAGAATTLLRESNGAGVLAEIPGTGLGPLDRLPTDFRDKRVMPFKKEEAARLVFRLAGGGEIVAEKAQPDAGTADSWRIVSPKSGPAKTFKLASVLWTLGSIKQTRVAEESPKDPGKWGIDSKSRSVTIFGADGKPLGRLEIGKEVPTAVGASYLRGTRDEVVEADNSRLTDLPTSVDDLLDVPTDAGTPDAGK